MKLKKLHAVIYQESGWWLAVGLEHSITTQAKTLSGVLRDFERMIQTQLMISSREAPFDNFPPADAEEWERFEHAETLAYSVALPADSSLAELRGVLETRIAA